MSPRPVAWIAGLFVGAAGLAWIMTTFTRRPSYDAVYHVPLAVVYTTVVADAWIERRTRDARGLLWTVAAASALIVGRIFEDWPMSGHAILGVLFAACARPKMLRLLGGAIVVQAAVTKLIVPGERPIDVVVGAAIGVILALVASKVDRARAATSH